MDLNLRAKFPQPKFFEGYDFSLVAFPDGYSEADLRSLEFVAAAQDFVFHGQTDRGKMHLAIAVGTACVAIGGPCASSRPSSSRWRSPARPETTRESR